MKTLEHQLIEKFRKSLGGLPGVTSGPRIETHLSSLRTEIDGLIDIEVQGKQTRLLIECKKQGYPRDLREAAWKLKKYLSHQVAANADFQDSVVLVVIAPSISPGGKEFLRQEGVGYWDTGDNLYLQLPNALYYLDRPASPEGGRPLRNLYRGTRAQVLHALLMDPEREWHIHDLAERAQVSKYTAHQVLGVLEQQLWVTKQGTGPKTLRTLQEPAKLLEAWADAHSLSQYEMQRFHRWFPSQSKLRQHVTSGLERLEIEHALTLGSAAELVAPFATNVERLSILVPDSTDLDQAAESLELKSVNEGENIVFFKTRTLSSLMFRYRVADQDRQTWVASNIQLYLDLWAYPARGKEQAKHLRQEKLSF